MNRILLALGGNALGNDSKKQESITRDTARIIVDLIEKGNELVVTHGNGPQVGMLNLALEDEGMPLAECIAMSQGYIGYHLEKSIKEELDRRGIDKSVSTMVTQVIVDKDDKAFKNPTKPIGRFYTRDEAEILEKDFTMKEDSNRGYRRYVASPKPMEIIEEKTIKGLLEKGEVVIGGGGGGVPVIREEGFLIGMDGVIDKDFTSELLAEVLDIDVFVILTEVDSVYINFGKETQETLFKLNTKKLRGFVEQGQFGVGSMLPKVEASINFVDSKQGRRAIITSLNKISEALDGKAGTLVGWEE